MFKSKSSKIYLILELMLLMALISFEIVLFSKGLFVWDNTTNFSYYMRALKVSLTTISLVFVVITFIINKNKKISTLDLLIIYFVFTVAADIIFSFGSISYLAHLFFFFAYIVFVFVRRGKWYEIFIPLTVGVIIFLILWLALSRDLIISLIDSLLGATLIFNMIMCYIKYAKTKEKFYLNFAIGTSFIFLSDLSIAIASLTQKNMVLANTIFMFNWPCYIVGNIFIVCNYMLCKSDKAGNN